MTFTVTATGTTPLSYQWTFNAAPLTNGGNISGATSAVLTLANVRATNSGAYSVMVTNLVEAVTSPVATLTVVWPPHFTSATLLPNGVPLVSADATSNLTYRIDASSNLLNWALLTNVPNPSGVLQFVDPAATNFPRRFYRAVWAP